MLTVAQQKRKLMKKVQTKVIQQNIDEMLQESKKQIEVANEQQEFHSMSSSETESVSSMSDKKEDSVNNQEFL